MVVVVVWSWSWSWDHLVLSIVLAGIYVCGVAPTLVDAARLAASMLQSGAAAVKLAEWAEHSNAIFSASSSKP